jgi:hypothetical protein
VTAIEGETPPPATRRVVRTERRQGPFRAGVILCVAGLAALVAGGLLLTGTQAAEVLGATGRAEVGSPITFDAEARRYALVYVRGELDSEQFIERAVTNLTCTVTAEDGSTQTVRGSRQTTASETEFGSSIGSFDAVAGRTEVLCTWIQDPGGLLQNYAVAPQRTAAEIASYVLLGLGVLLGVIGAVLLVIGIRGRAVIERRPVA